LDLNAKLQARARLYEKVRQYFSDEGLTEVFTPLLSFAGNPDPAIKSFETDQGSLGGSVNHAPMYLQTSPEFFMKRLLVLGSGSIFQICPAFRQAETGRFHNPEFAMLEWYRVGYNYFDLMADVSAMIESVTSLKPYVEQISYARLFEPFGLNPHSDSREKIKTAAIQNGINVQTSVELSRDDWLDLFMTHVIEPSFNPDNLVFVYDFPASQASLAKIITDNQGFQVAQRFELYWQGMELANGFTELQDADEQLQRFKQDNKNRERLGLPYMPLDQNFLNALQQGLPECSGVALGLDRLLMVISRADSISDVLVFPVSEV
jgi:lysyl-tRNA synthetase class 2